MELGPGIHLIPKIRGANAYVVTQDDHLTLIDTGMPGNATRIVEFLKSLGKKPIVSCTIVITHPDIDHSGSAAALKEKLENGKIAIHQADAPRLAGEKPLREARGLAGLALKLMTPFMRFTPTTPDLALKDGEEVNGLTVIHTPGHTEGSICLYSERLKAMFVGDALRTDRNGNPILPSKALAFDFEEAIRSVQKIASYEFAILLPGHGPPVLTDASRKVKKLVTRGGGLGR